MDWMLDGAETLLLISLRYNNGNVTSWGNVPIFRTCIRHI